MTTTRWHLPGSFGAWSWFTRGPHRAEGLGLLTRARDEALAKGFTLNALAIVDPEIAREKARNGDLDGAIELSRAAIDDMFDRGAMYLRGVATTILVESLLSRGAGGDLDEARAAIERLADVPVEPGFVLHEIPLLRLRALVARAEGDVGSVPRVHGALSRQGGGGRIRTARRGGNCGGNFVGKGCAWTT